MADYELPYDPGGDDGVPFDGADDEWSDDDLCYECSGIGDDYFVNKDGELECACATCPVAERRRLSDE